MHSAFSFSKHGKVLLTFAKPFGRKLTFCTTKHSIHWVLIKYILKKVLGLIVKTNIYSVCFGKTKVVNTAIFFCKTVLEPNNRDVKMRWTRQWLKIVRPIHDGKRDKNSPLPTNTPIINWGNILVLLLSMKREPRRTKVTQRILHTLAGNTLAVMQNSC